eukprot:Gb_22226 [translate_table: standard]
MVNFTCLGEAVDKSGISYIIRSNSIETHLLHQVQGLIYQALRAERVDQSGIGDDIRRQWHLMQHLGSHVNVTTFAEGINERIVSYEIRGAAHQGHFVEQNSGADKASMATEGVDKSGVSHLVGNATGDDHLVHQLHAHIHHATPAEGMNEVGIGDHVGGTAALLLLHNLQQLKGLLHLSSDAEALYQGRVSDHVGHYPSALHLLHGLQSLLHSPFPAEGIDEDGVCHHCGCTISPSSLHLLQHPHCHSHARLPLLSAEPIY